jgi:hypothetical protein
MIFASFSSRAIESFTTPAIVALGTTTTPSSSALTMSPGWMATPPMTIG